MAGGALVTLLLLFLVMDNFVLYWFVLFGGDQTLERRQQDSEWYGGFATDGSGHNGDQSGTSPGDGSSGAGGNYGSTGFVGNFNDMSPEEAVKVVSRNLSEDEKADFESAMRMFIYIMDRKGFVPNATIGAVSNMMAESGTMGLYAYESHYIKSNPGPDGSVNSRYLGNQAWTDWLNGPGREWARDKSSSYKGKASYAIGLGLIQSTDKWSRSSGEKTLSNATYLIESANEESMYWQEPGFQIPYYMRKYFTSEEPFGKAAWDVNQSPGVDPTKDANVTAYEWAVRVYCGVEYPALVYNKAKDYTSGQYYEQIITHTAGIEEARALYEKYSKVDPWFYSEQVVGENSWLDPFTGPAYDNTTPQGLMIARCAVLLAGRDRATSKKLIRTSEDNTYSNPEMVAEPGLQYYREAKMELESINNYFASCDRASSTAVILAGVDSGWTNFGPCSTLISYCNNSSAWKHMGKMRDVQMQPGDVLFKSSSGGHIAIWVGTNVAGERFPGTTSTVYQASLSNAGSSSAYFCDLSYGDPKSDYYGKFEVYRCVNPNYSGSKWEQFRSGRGSQFVELPAKWHQTVVATQPITRPENNSGAGSTTTQVQGLDINTVGWVYPLPLDQIHITSQPGSRTDPVYGGEENHRGTDIGAPKNTEIYAARSGKVVDAGWNDGRGYYYKIESDDGETTLFYQHMSEDYALPCKVGDHVDAGSLIGYVGSTGKSTGPHLHIEIWKNPYDRDNTQPYRVSEVYSNITFRY